ncbi:uncharacterized protein [Coffea arabica]|uniref:Uncharacterized protein isoform X1 n=2 Tax=Coffea arabica TaxID=13443 RepID=A0ABM4U444_COFAR
MQLREQEREMVVMAGACEECIRNCQLTHRNKMDLSPSVTRFFKVLVGDDFSQFLLLPRKFADTVMYLVNQETKLEDSNGVQWTVTLSLAKNSLAFTRGWQEFSLDHNLQAGDFLLFNYIKGTHFVVYIFDKSCCERASDKIGLPRKRARTRGSISSGGKPCEKIDTNPINRQNSSTSGVSGSNSKNSHILPTTTNSTLNAEGGNGNWSFLDSSFDMMIDWDAGPGLAARRMCLYDLSEFELQGDKEVADTDKGIDAVQSTSSHTQTSMRSQDEADKDPTGTKVGTKDLKIATFTEETDMGMMVNEKDLEAKDDMLLERDTDKGIDAVQGTSDHTQTSLRCQNGADKDPTGPEDLKLATFTEENDIGVMVNDDDLKPEDGMLLKCDTDKGIDAVQGSSGHSQTSLRCQDGADKDPTGAEDLKIATITEKTDIGMMVNVNNLEAEDDMFSERDSDRGINAVQGTSDHGIGMMVNYDELKPEDGMLLKCDTDKGIDAVQGSSDHSQTSLRCQDGADKDPPGTEDLKIATFTEETDIGMVVNDNNLEAKDDMLSEHDSDRGINAVQGTSDHREVSLRCQDGADKDPTRTKDLETATFTEETDIGMLVNDYNLGGKNDILLECEKVPLADRSNSLPTVLCPELGEKGGNMSNVYIQLQNAERSNKKYDVDWSSPYADEGACFRDSQEEFAGETKKMVRKEHPDTREEGDSSAKRLRGLKPLSVKEIGSSSQGPCVCKPVKLEPVDLLDIPSSVAESLTCLAMMDGQPYLELPAKLPGITYRKGMDRKSVLLQDQGKRFWPALYYYRSGFHVLRGCWDKFNKEHRIQAGDHYIFQAENVYRGIYKVSVLHQ